MAGTSSIGPERAVAAEDLAVASESLLDYLRNCGYAIGVDHHLRIERLALSLAASGGLPETGDLEAWVRPLVCQSPLEQEKFARDFREWMRTHRREPEAPSQGREFEQTLQEVNRGWLRWVVAALAVAAMVFILALALSRALADQTLLTTPEKAPAATAVAPAAETSHTSPFVFGVPLGVLAIALAAGLYWRRSRLRAFLVQQEARTPGIARELTVEPGFDRPIFNSRLLVLAAQGFGMYRRVESEDLDVRASVTATSREAGRFVPIYCERPAVPGYLVLTDRRSPTDLFARFADGITEALEANNVALERFHFDSSPQQCYAARGHRPVRADELVERYPGHRLLVFSDGSGFLNPLTQQFGAWMKPFEHWETRTLVTPAARPHWGTREKALEAGGWAVLAASQSSIAAMAQGIDLGGNDEKFTPGMLRSIAEHERRWMKRTAPAPEQIAELLVDLRVSLGVDGFAWLCSCAAYPAVDWVVTMYLGVNVAGSDGKPLLRESSFLALSRLPWFRYGRFPE